jgi:hypothetical protein
LKSGDIIQFDVHKFRFSVPDHTPKGGTVLTGRAGSAKTGTVLRPGGPPAVESSQSELNEPKQGPELSETDNADQNKKTKLKPGMCPNHPARKATEMCHKCHKVFCKQCMSETHPDNCKECEEMLT